MELVYKPDLSESSSSPVLMVAFTPVERFNEKQLPSSINKLLYQFRNKRLDKPQTQNWNGLRNEFVDDLVNSISVKIDGSGNMDHICNFIEESESDESVKENEPITKHQGSQLFIEFHGLTSPKELKRTQGYLFLSLQIGEYPLEVYNQDGLLHSLSGFLEEWILSQNLCPEVDPSFLQITNHVRNAIFIGAPVLIKSTEKFKIFLKFTACQWIMNDFITRSVTSGQIPFLPKTFFKDLAKIVRNIMAGEYQIAEAIPYFDIHLFHHCLKALFNVYLDLKDNIGAEIYEKYHKPLLQELLDWIESHKILSHHFHHNSSDFGLISAKYDGDLELNRYLSGRGILLEVIHLLSGATLDSCVRDLRLFKMYHERGLTANVLSLDMLNLNSKVLREDFNKAVINFIRVERCIVEDFLGSGNSGRRKLARFLRNFGCFIDGEVRAQIEEWKIMGRGGCFQVYLR